MRSEVRTHGNNTNVSVAGGSATNPTSHGLLTVGLGNGGTFDVGSSGREVIQEVGGARDTFILSGGTTTINFAWIESDNMVFIHGGRTAVHDTAGNDGLQLHIGAEGGTVAVTGFSIPSAELVFDSSLFATTADVLAASKDDGHGGTMILLPHNLGSVDLHGTPFKSLGSNNIQIG